MQICLQMGILDKYAAFNEEMRELSREMGRTLRVKYAAVTTNSGTESIADTLSTNAGKRYGIVDRIAAKFKQHGVFIERGSGRGYGGTYGTFYSATKGRRIPTAAASKGKQGSGSRPKQPWLSPVIDDFAGRVADRAAKHFSDIGAQLVTDAIPTVKIRR